MTNERKEADRADVPAAEPKKRRFWVRIDALVEIDDRLLASVLTDEWRQDYYRLFTAGDVAAHLAYNLIQRSSLASLDGFADQPEDRAVLLEIDVDDGGVDEVAVPISVEETRTTVKATGRSTKKRGGARRAPRTRATPRRTRP